MSTLTLIGDVHGKVNEYWKLVTHQVKGKSVQVGDFGFKESHEWHRLNIDGRQHKVLFGNHDDYTYLNREHSLGDYAVLHGGEIMAVRGGYSIDKARRTMGVDWWAEEEMNFETWVQCIDAYTKTRPSIVLSHECPADAVEQMFGITSSSNTAKGLQALFDIHQPKLWVFGHHHKSCRKAIEGTEFVCLAEGESLWI